jgi:hypothetical protein
MILETMIVAGAAAKIYGDYQSNKAQAAAAAAQARVKRIQAYDLLERSEYNIRQTKQEADIFKHRQIATSIKSGVDITGSALLALEDTAMKLSVEVTNQQKEASAKANALFMGADIDMQLSGDIRKAGQYQMYGSLLSTSQAFL